MNTIHESMTIHDSFDSGLRHKKDTWVCVAPSPIQVLSPPLFRPERRGCFVPAVLFFVWALLPDFFLWAAKTISNKEWNVWAHVKITWLRTLQPKKYVPLSYWSCSALARAFPSAHCSSDMADAAENNRMNKNLAKKSKSGTTTNSLLFDIFWLADPGAFFEADSLPVAIAILALSLSSAFWALDRKAWEARN